MLKIYRENSGKELVETTVAKEEQAMLKMLKIKIGNVKWEKEY